MIIEYIILFALVICVSLLAYKHRTWPQILSIAALIVVTYLSFFELPGQGKNLLYEWRDIGKAKVYSTLLENGVKIHLWLIVDGELKYYYVPWSESRARELTQHINYVKRMGKMKGLNYVITLNRDETGTITLHSEPPPARPNKPVDEVDIIE